MAAALVAAMTMAGAAHAQAPPPGRIVANAQPPCRFGQFSISANGRNGVLAIQVSADNTISGQVFGDRISGYYVRRHGVLVWLRGPANAESQIYVGRCSSDIRPNSSAIVGVLHALNGAGGATAQRNAFAFRAWQPLAIMSARPPSNPANSPMPLADPRGAWWATADAVNSGLVIEVDQKGAVSGALDGGPIAGHYASEAGTMAFLRFRCTGLPCITRTPVQFYEGKSVGTGASARFEGRYYGLDATHAPASANGASFGAANRQPDFYHYESLTRPTECLDISFGQYDDQAHLQLHDCDGASKNQDLAVLSVGPNGADSLVVRHSAKCLDVPDGSTASGVTIQQYRCHGGANQQVDLESGTRIRFRHSDLCIGYEPNPGFPDLGVQVECGSTADFLVY